MPRGLDRGDQDILSSNWNHAGVYVCVLGLRKGCEVERVVSPHNNAHSGHMAIDLAHRYTQCRDKAIDKWIRECALH